MSSRPVWSTKGVPEHLGLQRDSVSNNQFIKKKKSHRVLRTLGWPATYHVAEDNPELLIHTLGLLVYTTTPDSPTKAFNGSLFSSQSCPLLSAHHLYLILQGSIITSTALDKGILDFLIFCFLAFLSKPVPPSTWTLLITLTFNCSLPQK